MQNDGDYKKERLEKMVNKKETTIKRTTIILEKDEREFIDQLIRDEKEPGIKPLISKMLAVYQNMRIYEWRFPGEYYFGISRMTFINVELLNILIQHIPKEKWRETGEKMGIALKVSLETTFGLQAAHHENWNKIFKQLSVQGLGNFYLKDKYLLVKTPLIIEPEIWEGILEGLLDIELNMKTTVPPLVFEIKTKKQFHSNKSKSTNP